MASNVFFMKKCKFQDTYFFSLKVAEGGIDNSQVSRRLFSSIPSIRNTELVPLGVNSIL